MQAREKSLRDFLLPAGAGIGRWIEIWTLAISFRSAALGVFTEIPPFRVNFTCSSIFIHQIEEEMVSKCFSKIWAGHIFDGILKMGGPHRRKIQEEKERGKN